MRPTIALRQHCSLLCSTLIKSIDEIQTVPLPRRRNAEAIRDGSVALHWGTVKTLPFADDQFDRTLAVNSLHHWPKPEVNLREVHRVLKPSGCLVIAEQPVWSKDGADDCRFARELTAQVQAAGFDPVEVVSRRMCPAPTICVRGVKPAPKAI